MTGERVAIRLCQRWRAAANHRAGTHRVHEIPHHQNAADCIRRIKLAARIERIGTLGNDFSGKRDICGNDQVTSSDALNDLVVSNIET